MEYVLRTDGLTKLFSGRPAVNNVSLSVKKGDIYGFIGKNGAGKTTLIRMAVGLAAPTSGSIELFGSNNLKKQRRRVGTVIEYPAVFPHMTARQNLEAQCSLLGMKDASVIDSTLHIVGLNPNDRKKAKNFSLGMKQRLAIALSLVGNPELLFLDEPINGLDPTGIKEIRTLIQTLNREHGITVLISSHILGELSKLATRYGIINNGRLVEEFTAEQLEEHCQSSLMIRVSDPAAASSLLKQQFGIQRAAVNADGTLAVYEQIERAGAINTALVSSGLTVDSLHVTAADLEEYFINAIGGNVHA